MTKHEWDYFPCMLQQVFHDLGDICDWKLPHVPIYKWRKHMWVEQLYPDMVFRVRNLFVEYELPNGPLALDPSYVKKIYHMFK